MKGSKQHSRYVFNEAKTLLHDVNAQKSPPSLIRKWKIKFGQTSFSGNQRRTAVSDFFVETNIISTGNIKNPVFIY